MLSALQLVNPHWTADGPAARYETVPASDPHAHAVAEVASALDVEIAAGGRTMRLPEFHAQTASTSLLVLADGRVVHEWYEKGLGRQDLFLGASATKSLLAHLVGVAVGSGALDLKAPVDAYVPELRDSGYADVPVSDLLSMTSGVDWLEDHRDPRGQGTALLLAFATGASSRAVLTGVRRRYPPGMCFEYCTADSQVLDWVRERATGISFCKALAELWRSLSCTEDAVVAVDGDGVALAGGGLAAAAGDWARVGLLQVDGVSPSGTRLLDRSWVHDSSRPPLPFLRPGRLPSSLSTHVGFGYHWWPLDDAGDHVSADGSRGQFVYVARPRRVVVVKTSAWAYADRTHDRQCRDLSYLALSTIVDAVAHAPQARSASQRKG